MGLRHSGRVKAMLEFCGTEAFARRAFLAFAAVTCLVFAGHVLYSAFCALSWQNFLMSDYGVYTNTLYNLANGEGFRFLVDHNYLKTHLSFSLVLLVPLIWVWESPYLLIVVQWLFLIGGACIVWRIMHRLKIPVVLQAALLLLWVAYPFTQSVLLSEFHGVSAYLLLIPWLLYCLSFRRAMVVLPWLCILGLREEAGLLILPLLLYFAFREKWKGVDVYIVLSIVYVCLAVWVLYPWINGEHLLSVRGSEASVAGIAKGGTRQGLQARAIATFWMLFPCIPFLVLLRRGRLVLLLPVLAAWLIAMASGVARQYSLAFHYPAPIIALIMVGLIFACTLGLADLEGKKWKSHIVWGLALWLVGSVGVAHYFQGFFLGGGRTNRVYVSMHLQEKALRAALNDIPKDGILLTSHFLAPHVAMRSDVVTWRYWKSEAHKVEWLLFRYGEYAEPGKEYIKQVLESGEFGVFSSRFPFVLLKRAHDVSKNEALVSSMRANTASIYRMGGDAGDLFYHDEEGLVRYWSGDLRSDPVRLVYGHRVALRAGQYEALFHMSLDADTKLPLDELGTLSVHEYGQDKLIASAKILPNYGELFHVQSVTFELLRDTTVEPRVEGGRAQLWLKHVGFRLLPATELHASGL